MALYEYHAEGPTGEPVLGHLEAPDESAARSELAARGLKILEVLWCPSTDHAGSLQDEQLTTFVDAIGGAAENRLPLEITLAALAEESNDRRLAAAAQQMASDLERGATIEQAIAGLDRQLPTEVAGLLRAGVEGGDLAGTIGRLATQKVAAQRIRRKIQSAIAYPLLIAVILVPLLLFLSIYVIPMFAAIFLDFELNLPVMTTVLIQISNQLPMLLGGLIIVMLVLPLALRFLGGRWLFHRVRAATPMLGQLWTWSGQREFAALLGSFVDLRLPLTDAVVYTGDAMADRNVGRACRRVAKRLESGESLSSCLGRSIHFDRSLVALVIWGETYGVLPEALNIATNLFDDQIDQYASLVRRVLPPIALISVASLMFVLLVALMVPLVSLINDLSR